MKILAKAAMAGVLGVAVGLSIPRATSESNAEEMPQRVRSESRAPALAGRTWSSGGGLAGDRVTAFIDAASRLSAGQWRAFFDREKNSPEWADLAAKLWADADPHGFWSYIRESRDPLLYHRWGPELFRTWTAADPDGAARADVADHVDRRGERGQDAIGGPLLLERFGHHFAAFAEGELHEAAENADEFVREQDERPKN